MLTAKDIMNGDVVTINKDTPLIEAAKTMSRNDITGIPVVEEDMTLVGVVTEKDILHLYDILQYSESRTANSSMTHEVVSFDVDDDFYKVLECLKSSDFRRVPVTSEGKVVGIISRRDMLVNMVKQREKHAMETY